MKKKRNRAKGDGAHGQDLIQVIIETPKGSRNKIKYDTTTRGWLKISAHGSVPFAAVGPGKFLTTQSGGNANRVRRHVALACELFYEGNCVMLDHGQHFFTIYMHLSKIQVREGQKVRKRQRWD